MKKALFGLAKSRRSGIQYRQPAQRRRLLDNDISVLFPNKTGTRHLAHLQRTRAPEGAATGASVGIVVGAALGWLLGIGTLAIPVLDLSSRRVQSSPPSQVPALALSLEARPAL